MKKFLLLCLVVFAVVTVSGSFLAAPVSASGSTAPPDLAGQAKCTDTANCVGNCPDPAATGNVSGTCDKSTQGCSDQNCDIVGLYVNPFIKFLGIGLGLAVTIGIAWGGIEYASSGGDPQKTASGKKHISWAIIVLVLYFFLYALVKFLAPGL